MASPDDMLELEAALSAACHSKDATDVDNEEPPTLDSTPLFAALQNSEWQQALDLCTPTSLSTWVQSSGNALSTYVIWKRLPIHEAARRQAPAWLLVKMLELAPESASATTQFGELPLHVAVETGSTPEVIHLLLVAYMEGVVMCDNSGRTPLQICREGEYPDPVVLESLERATTNHTALLERHARNIQQLEQDHEEEICKLREAHASDLHQKHQELFELQQSLQGAKLKVQEMSSLSLESQSLAENKAKETVKYQGQVHTMRQEMDQLIAVKESQRKELEQLYETLEQSNAQIASLKGHVATLEEDLQNCLIVCQTSIAEAMQTQSEDLMQLVASHEALQGQLSGQVQGMELLLEKRSIAIPEIVMEPQEEEIAEEIIPEVDTSTAIDAATKAATKALERSNAKQGYV